MSTTTTSASSPSPGRTGPAAACKPKSWRPSRRASRTDPPHAPRRIRQPPDSAPGPARSVFRRWFYAGVTAFGVIGEQARRSLLAAGISPQKMFSSPYAVDSDLFESSDAALDRESCRRLLGISADRFVLLFSGKLLPGKNTLLVLKALEQMPERGRVTFVALGDGPERCRLEHEGSRLLGGNFVLAGFK